MDEKQYWDEYDATRHIILEGPEKGDTCTCDCEVCKPGECPGSENCLHALYRVLNGIK